MSKECSNDLWRELNSLHSNHLWQWVVLQMLWPKKNAPYTVTICFMWHLPFMYLQNSTRAGNFIRAILSCTMNLKFVTKSYTVLAGNHVLFLKRLSIKKFGKGALDLLIFKYLQSIPISVCQSQLPVVMGMCVCVCQFPCHLPQAYGKCIEWYEYGESNT